MSVTPTLSPVARGHSTHRVALLSCNTHHAPSCDAGLPLRAHHPPTICRRDYAAYGKGCCCTAFGCCRKKCRTGFKDDGGCMCKRDANTIWKSTYDRGAGYAKYRTRIKDSYMPGSRTAIRSFTKRTAWRDAKPLTCPPGKENDAGLCYTPCASGYTGEQGAGGSQHERACTCLRMDDHVARGTVR